MAFSEATVCNGEECLFVSLPMTQPTGKVRVKERSFFYEYGKPVSVRRNVLGLSHYVEWQICYDLPANQENLQKTTLKEMAKWIIGKEEGKLSLELFRVFGMLSSKHRHDVLEIFSVLFDFIKKK